MAGLSTDGGGGNRILRFPLWFCVVTAALVACSSQEEPARPARPSKPARVAVSGSGTLVPLMKRLADHYQADHPDETVALLPGTSTGGGVTGVRQGVLDVGLCSRRLSPEEQAGVRYSLLGYDLIVFGVHPSAKVSELSAEDLLGIYRGRIRNWSELGGVDRDILVLDRDEGESIKITLRRHFFGPDFPVVPSATVFLRAGDMAQALRTTPYAIGYAGRGELRARALDLKIVPPRSRWPRPEEVVSGAYPLVIPLGIVTAPTPRPEAARFVEFLTGPQGRAVLDALGCFAAPPEAPRGS
ncbi:MAG: phosphate ABC transporter substrate-binding protein [Deferrisomatales bacterium]